jgi:hypothetical protein
MRTPIKERTGCESGPSNLSFSSLLLEIIADLVFGREKEILSGPLIQVTTVAVIKELVGIQSRCPREIEENYSYDPMILHYVLTMNTR